MGDDLTMSKARKIFWIAFLICYAGIGLFAGYLGILKIIAWRHCFILFTCWMGVDP